jgi:hypothetical protein
MNGSDLRITPNYLYDSDNLRVIRRFNDPECIIKNMTQPYLQSDYSPYDEEWRRQQQRQRQKYQQQKREESERLALRQKQNKLERKLEQEKKKSAQAIKELQDRIVELKTQEIERSAPQPNNRDEPGLPNSPVKINDGEDLIDAGVSECIVCMDAGVNVLLMPCRHMQLCHDCAQDLNECPTCRKPIEERIKGFT